MSKFIFFAAVLLSSFSAQALSLSYYGEASIPTGEKFQKTVIGGLSGMHFHEGIVYIISDDKGGLGEPRFYEFELKLKDKKVEFKPKAVHFISGVPDDLIKKGGLDLEALVRFPNGDLLLSSEGKVNARPRIPARLIRVSAAGQWKSDLALPEKFNPEPLGQQKTGVQNNRAIEALSGFDGGRVVMTTSESALQQDLKLNEEHQGDLVRLVKYVDTGKGLQAVGEYPYKTDAFTKSTKGQEFFRGISEILLLSENKVIVLERGVRLNGTAWASTVTLYLADLAGARDVSGVRRLTEEKIQGVPKVKLLDFETDLASTRPGKSVENFEALSWGPNLPDGKKTLLVLSDNNFSKKQKTELLVFSVEGE